MLLANRLPLHSSATIAMKIKEAESFMTSVEAQQMIIRTIPTYALFNASKLKSPSKIEVFIHIKFRYIDASSTCVSYINWWKVPCLSA